jgi:hypothetical protein
VKRTCASRVFSCGIMAATIGIGAAPSPAFAALRTFILTWTSTGTGAARGTLTIDDALCSNPGVNNFLGPAGCFVDATFTVSGDIKGKGTYTLDDMMGVSLQSGVALDFGAELIAQGPTDINFFANFPGPGGTEEFVMAAPDPDATDFLTLVSAEPLVFPLAADAAKCSGAVAKAGAAYFSARHKAIHACRSAFAKGTALFADQAKTVPVLLPGRCTDEFKVAIRIAKARTRLRAALARKCDEAALAAIPACAATVAALADPAAGTGCLLETVDFNVEEMIRAEFGF